MYLKLLRRFLRGIFMVGCYNRILNLRGIRPLLWIAESFQWETKKLCIFLTHCSWFAVERFSKFFFIEMEIYCFLQLAFKKHAKRGVDYRAEGEMLEHSTITVGISVEWVIREALIKLPFSANVPQQWEAAALPLLTHLVPLAGCSLGDMKLSQPRGTAT